MQTSDFDFELPAELIAQTPSGERSGSRLLRLAGDRLSDHHFSELPALLRAGDLLVANDTRVMKARLLGVKAGSGGRVEALVERVISQFEALAQLRASKAFRVGARLRFAAGQAGSTCDPATAATGNNAGADIDAAAEFIVDAEVIGRDGEFHRLRFARPVLQVLDDIGLVPLPPYIDHAAGAEDLNRYQTVYAREPGSVAAPTAGLHFDPALFEALEQRGVQRSFVTLHVGAGTFKPVRGEDLAAHIMHEERYSVSPATAAAVNQARAEGRRVIAVGTTAARTLESAVGDQGLLQAGDGATRLFITPGYRFRLVDAMITNFHLPRSTLLMLVSALAGVEPIREAYRHAIAERYRFFSYGDAMLIEPSDAESDRQEPGSIHA